MLERRTLLASAAGIACASLASPAAAQDAADADWAMADAIVARLERPRIPRRTFPITRFGARSGQDAHAAIAQAIAAASAAGGGRVVIPAGRWLCNGPVHLQSRIELHLARGATLLFSPRAADYLPVVKTRWEGTELYGYSPLIYARDVEDVAITGPGTLDGNGESEFKSWIGRSQPDMLALRRAGIDGVAVEQRQFGEGHFLRPSMLQIFGGRRVLLEDYTITNSPFWVNHLVYCDHVTVRGLRVDSRIGNNDGVDVDSSSNVLIENCHFTTGDDSVVVKSGRDADGRRVARPSEYVVVRNNDMGGEDGIALGSEMSGDVRHIFFTDNVMRSGASAFRFKANLDRGGLVEHIRVRNMVIERFETLFWFQLNYPGEMGGNFPSTYRDIVFENLRVEAVGAVIDAHAPAGHPLRDVTIRNVAIGAAERTFVLENVEGLVLENLTIGGQQVDATLNWRAPG